MKMFRKRKIAKKLSELGSRVDLSYMVYVNNDEPVRLSSKDEVQSYISSYRETNTIFKLQIFRCEIYSL